MNRLLIFTIAITLFACNSKTAPDCLKSTGKIEKEIRALPAEVSRVELHNRIDIVFVRDSLRFLELEGGRNILPKIATKIEGNSLRILDENRCQWTRSYKKTLRVFYHSPTLPNQFDQYGFGDVSGTDSLVGDQMTLNVFGVSKLNLDLHLNFLKIDAGKYGQARLTGSIKHCVMIQKEVFLMDASELAVNHLDLAQNSERNVQVWCRDTLEVSINNVGNAYYKGQPVVKWKEKDGDGELRPLLP